MVREIKPGEQRVALTPAGACALVEAGHRVLLEPGAGLGSGIRDEEYVQAGASLAAAESIWAEADLILKVKEPLPQETRALLRQRVIGIAYETVQRGDGSLA